MIWTAGNNNTFSFEDDIEIRVNSYVYGSDSHFFINAYGERFKNSNIPLIIKRLQKGTKASDFAANLLDIIGFEHVLMQVYTELIKLETIQYLILDVSQLRPELTQLKSLKGITLLGKSTDTLPDYLAELPNLIWLDISEVRLNKIPDCVFKMSQLRGMKLKPKSALSQLPLLFDSLRNLEFLELLNCGITTLPENIHNLKQLKILSLEKNKIVWLPAQLANLAELKYFSHNSSTKTSEKPSYLPRQLTYLKVQEHDFIPILKSLAPNIHLLQISLPSLAQNKASFTYFSNLSTLIVEPGKDNNYPIEFSFQDLSELPFLENLDLSRFTIPPNIINTIGYLKQLKHLTLKISNTINLDCIGELKELRSLNIEYDFVEKLEFMLPKAWGELQNLESFSLIDRRGDSKISFNQLHNLPKLTNIELGSETFGLDRFISENVQIERIGGYRINEELPSFRKLINLKSFFLKATVFGDIIPTEVNYFQKLEELHLYINTETNLENLESFLKELGQIQSFKKIEIFERELILTKAWGTLNDFKQIIVSIILESREPSIELAFLPNAILEKSNGWADWVHSEVIDKFKQIRKYDLDDIQRVLFFGIITDNFAGLRDYISNTLPHTLKENSCVYIVGKLHGITKPQAIEQLATKNIKIANKLTNEVTHIVFGSGLSTDEGIKIVTSGKELALAEYLTEWLNSPDDFYLLQEENQELNQRIIPLFLSEEHSNHQLALEILKGGGVTKRLLTYLYVFQGCHSNLEIRKDARKLFRRFAPAEIDNHYVGGNWDGMKGELSEYAFRHPALNYWDGVLAYQQFRNLITEDRLRRTWTFSRDQPNTISISQNNIFSIESLPSELSLVKADGVCLKSFYAPDGKIEEFLKHIIKIPQLYPQLRFHFYCQYGDITQAQCDLLASYFQQVHLSEYFKIKE